MSEHPGSLMSPGGCMLRCLSAAGSRLKGRWDDPSAWLVICEELSQAWSGLPAVAWVVVCARNGLGPVDVNNDHMTAATVIWTAAAGRSRWLDLAADQAFWSSLATAPDGLLTGRGQLPFPVDRNIEANLTAARWLACGVPGPHGHGMALILGYSSLGQAEPDADHSERLADELTAACALIAPMLGFHHRLADLSTAAATSRSECEALSRLGELRSRLAAVTAHELKTPLTSITAYAEVLEQQANNPGFAHTVEFLRVIRSETDRLLRLVDRLLDSSRRGRGPALVNPQPVSAGPLCQEVRRVMAPQAAARDLRLDVYVSQDLPRLEGDADLLRQVLLNVLSNALKFTPAGGRVTVSAREEASTVRLTVSDSGPGIAPHELRAIFQSFYRTRSASRIEGVGLGLSIVKEIISLHGGHLDVNSRRGRGSTFGIHLPKEQQLAVQKTALAASGADLPLLQRLARHTLRLVAELAAARGVALLLPAATPGELIAAAVSGLGSGVAEAMMPADSRLVQRSLQQALLVHGGDVLPAPWTRIVDQPGGAMLAPLRIGDTTAKGLILAVRRLKGGAFDADDLLLMRVLAEILGKAWSAALASHAARDDQEMVAEALAALTGLRRSGVPTADPLALRVLSRTGRKLGQTPFEIRLLQYAGALHDAGMVLMDPDVLLKPAELDLDERDHIGHHPQRGLDLLGSLVALPDLQAIIRHHHERIDGQGYPEGRRGEAIPLGSRILAVVDAFFAMIRSRPWREGLPVAAAAAEIKRHAGTQFDEDVVAGFLKTLLEEGLLSPENLERTAKGAARR